jgi:hypothetical protein
MTSPLYLQYHNIEAQGTLPHPWATEPLRVGIYTKVATAKQAAGRVMLLAGLGQPRRYYLWSSFIIEQCHHSSGAYHLEGPGWQLAPPARLIGPAFTRFKAECANFIGFRQITTMPFAQELQKLADEHQPPGPATAMQAALREMSGQVQNAHARHALQAQLASSPPAGNVPTVALSVRQPHAEAILRGIKTIEYRSFPTTRRGRVLLYASRIPVDDIDYWMKFYGMHGENYDALAKGVIVGSVEVYDSQGGEWHLRHPQRASKLLVPTRRPQPVWFTPF